MSDQTRPRGLRYALALAVAAGTLVASFLVPSSSSAAAQDYSADALSANVHAQCSLKLSYVDSEGRHYQLSSQAYPNSLSGYVTIKRIQAHCLVLNGESTVVETTRKADSSVLTQNQQSFNVLSGPTTLCADGKATFTSNATETTGTVCVALNG